MFTAAEIDWYKAGCLIRQPRLEPGRPDISSVHHAMARVPEPNPAWVVPDPSDEETN